MQNAEFNHPRLTQVYDAQSDWGTPEQLFLELVNETPGARIADLGCGTGRITLRLAEAGHTVTGIDPARASLEAAQMKPGAQRVTWLEGTSVILAHASFDLILMTCHVAQFITGDEEWTAVLADVHRALVPGGRLVFESRDPQARAWEKWNPVDSRDRVTLPDGTNVDLWTEITELNGETVTFVHHYTFSDSPQELLSRSTLRFRPEETLRATLEAAGFDIECIYGGWHREPVGQGDGEFIVIARARE